MRIEKWLLDLETSKCHGGGQTEIAEEYDRRERRQLADSFSKNVSVEMRRESVDARKGSG